MRTVTLVAFGIAVAVAAPLGSSCSSGHRRDMTSASGGLGRPLRVGLLSWPGFVGGIVANNGFNANEKCPFWSYGLSVQFVLLEEAGARSKQFEAGGLDVICSTVDCWANESVHLLTNGVKARAVMQVDWSQGGDAIVADNTIKTVEDLRDKRVSLEPYTPSEWLLAFNLDNCSLNDTEKSKIVHQVVARSASPDARGAFAKGKVDAAVVREPDVTEALERRPESHVLISTEKTSRLIADLMVAREDLISEYPCVISAFIQGWLEGNREASSNPGLAARLLIENEPLYKDMGEEATRRGLDQVKLADLSDNIRMFGLDGSDALFNGIFAMASKCWLSRGYISHPAQPSDVKDEHFLRDIYLESPPLPSPFRDSISHRPSDIETARPLLTKPVNIFFDKKSSDLSDDSKQTLDRRVGLLVQANANAYIRIEGNTDNTGNGLQNERLSKSRAEAVAKYLVDRYSLSPQQFVTKGNGADKPIDTNITSRGRASNRRTDVEVLDSKVK